MRFVFRSANTIHISFHSFHEENSDEKNPCSQYVHWVVNRSSPTKVSQRFDGSAVATKNGRGYLLKTLAGCVFSSLSLSPFALEV